MMSKKQLPRGIRNNNPGNIENNGIAWNGLSDTQTDSRFYQFNDARYGIRAIARIIKTYSSKYGLNTVRGIINRWAPPHENDTGAYVDHVAAVVGVDPDQLVDVHNETVMTALVTTIIQHENGVQPYDQSLIQEGVMMA
ncbi:hypothetical protein [Alkalimarinus coralli]|uniref:hypothetical protein n=1 Tax=Alkalimarinus coralli TaxID=2935863 RepID=UPI00202B542D|nr:hypothetical protein [Alkalimarinus coralli]